MKFGMRFGNKFGDPDPQAVYVQVPAEAPGDRLLTITPENSSGVVHHLMIDGFELVQQAGTSFYGAPQDARDHIEFFETSDQNADENLENVASSASDRVRLTWPEATGMDSGGRYELFRKVSGGSYPSDPLHVFPAGDATYTYEDGPLDDATYVYKLVAYDAAGNTVDSNEPSQAVNAAPLPPSGLAITVVL